MIALLRPRSGLPQSAEPVHRFAQHLVKARGYAREVSGGAGGDWEREMLTENLLLAEDHAEALGAMDVRTAIRAARKALAAGADPLSCAENALAAGRPLFPNPHT